MILECSDCMLCTVAAMHIGRHQLKLGLPGDSDGVPLGCTSLIIKDLEINCKTVGHQTGHDGVVGSDAMLAAPGLEGLLKDDVSIGMIGNHGILVAQPDLDREPSGTSIVCVELADGEVTDENLVGRGFRGDGWWGRGNGGLGLGGMNVLALLGEMTQDGLVRIWAVPRCIGVGEAIKSVTVVGFDGIQPCLLATRAAMLGRSRLWGSKSKGVLEDWDANAMAWAAPYK